MKDILIFIEQIKTFMGVEEKNNEFIRYLISSTISLISSYEEGEYDKDLELKEYIEREIKTKSAILFSKIKLDHA
jgi:hypothetical protein